MSLKHALALQARLVEVIPGDREVSVTPKAYYDTVVTVKDILEIVVDGTEFNVGCCTVYRLDRQFLGEGSEYRLLRSSKGKYSAAEAGWAVIVAELLRWYRRLEGDYSQFQS